MNQELLSLNGGSLEITLTVSLIKSIHFHSSCRGTFDVILSDPKIKKGACPIPKGTRKALASLFFYLKIRV